MNQKTLLSLMTLGSIGCAGNDQSALIFPDPSVLDPYQYTSTAGYEKQTWYEEQIMTSTYQNQEEKCLHSLYVETKESKNTSFLVTEHCVLDDEGVYNSLRFKDTDANGIIYEVCAIDAKTYVGVFASSRDECWVPPFDESLFRIVALFLKDSSLKNPSSLSDT